MRCRVDGGDGGDEGLFVRYFKVFNTFSGFLLVRLLGCFHLCFFIK